MAKIATYKTCWLQTGLGGRWTLPVACMQAWSIFDDKAHIIKEAKGGGPMKHHGKGFMDFTQAVDQ